MFAFAMLILQNLMCSQANLGPKAPSHLRLRPLSLGLVLSGGGSDDDEERPPRPRHSDLSDGEYEDEEAGDEAEDEEVEEEEEEEGEFY